MQELLALQEIKLPSIGAMKVYQKKQAVFKEEPFTSDNIAKFLNELRNERSVYWEDLARRPRILTTQKLQKDDL